MTETTTAGGEPRVSGRRRVLSRLSVVVLLASAAVSLAVGSGLGRSSPPTLTQRAAALESRIRCPSCEDISVAQSEASAAVAARHTIVSMLASGDSDAQIEQSFVDRYGPSILLEPPGSGLSDLVWILPSVGGALVLIVVGALFWRRGRDLHRLRES